MTATTSGAAGRAPWQAANRIVVKIGSALLVDRATGVLRAAWLNALLDDIAALHARGRDVVIVSSGAIALGRGVLGFNANDLTLEQSQAAAAVGQISLAHAYQNAGARHNLVTAQVLLTLGDTEERRRYLNARQTIETLLSARAIPVVNENDTVATSEIRYGDNDRLSARVASMISADVLVLLSDIDGLYTAPPGTVSDVKHIPFVEDITPAIEAMAGAAATSTSRGGMVTKIEAAKIARGAGTSMVITLGDRAHPLHALEAGARATWFLAPSNPVAARKRWIAGQLEPRGTITIDAGAITALEAGNSLLPAGVIAITGTFDRGDVVVVHDPAGQERGRGLIAYPLKDARLIMGKHSRDIPALVGYHGRSALIHRDDLVLTRVS
ncbi:MAG: glutamate 5-kinase [Pseudomonadota bacterium]